MCFPGNKQFMMLKYQRRGNDNNITFRQFGALKLFLLIALIALNKIQFNSFKALPLNYFIAVHALRVFASFSRKYFLVAMEEMKVSMARLSLLRTSKSVEG